ncbi:uncharacterized protein BXZ73DRAFT_81626 [Epithele typhae]|uniref:uncharacterized protein n=1 Tax=Epithele typhae TaxID=378194 RepID=UPI002008BE1A|nr:uncharacterized protein BXZ73DRAFT_81626 [Epithele typhae]KAH9914659.1 hypothetical protein BXZ73DRAFT_81626 [Epithele typhae]
MLFCSCLVPLLLWVAAAATSNPSNRTIDDQKGDDVLGTVPVYAPSSAWKQGATCDGCYPLNTANVRNGTWHEATYTPDDTQELTITVTFTGTAVYVYNVLTDAVQNKTPMFTRLTFTLDGTEIGDYTHGPTTDTDFEYNALTFSSTGFVNEPHTFVISSGNEAASVILFDYIVYTAEENTLPDATTTSSRTSTSNPTTSTTNSVSSPSSSQSPPSSTAPASSSLNTAAIGGGVAGGVVAILAAAALLFFLCRRNRNRTPDTAVEDMQYSGSRAASTPGLAGGGHPTTLSAPSSSGAYTGGNSAAAAGSAGPIYSPVSAGSTANVSSSGDPFASPCDAHPSPSTLSNSSSRPSTAGNEAQPTSALGPHALRPLRRIPSDVPVSPGATLYAASPLQPNRLSSATSMAGSPRPGTGSEASRPESSTTSSTNSRPLRVVQPLPIPPTENGFPAEKAQFPDAAVVHSIPVPPIPEEPPRSASPGAMSTATGISTLRTQLQILQEEVERLREQQELQRMMDLPPTYSQ